jgi:hypothetical protein
VPRVTPVRRPRRRPPAVPTTLAASVRRNDAAQPGDVVGALASVLLRRAREALAAADGRRRLRE